MQLVSTLRIQSPDAAVALIPDGAQIVSTSGTGEPTTLLKALDRAACGRGWTLFSGMLFGDCPFLTSVEAGELRYRTWHVTKPVRQLVQSRQAEYLPVRASAIAKLLQAHGVDAALVRIGPPDVDGMCSLGGSTSYAARATELAGIAIAEIDPAVPRTCGDGLVSVDAFSAVVESSEEIRTYAAAARNDASDRITRHIVSLLPAAPTLQVGVGAVPESLVSAIADNAIGRVRIVGMVTDDMIDLADAGLIRGGRQSGDGDLAAIVSPELHGTRRLLEWSAANPLLEMHPSSVAHDACRLGAIDRFISVNSAIEVDLYGAVNSEVAGGRQVSGTGGSIDYVESAARSLGGMSIIALTASGPGGSSRIVPSVGTTSLPRSMVDVVVTEYGIARLKGRSLRERSEALIAIASPERRDDLQNMLDGAQRSPATG
jgi:acyl-CoA hydrolase